MSSSTPPDDASAEVLAVFDRRDDPCEPLSTAEVAAVLDRSKEAVRDCLERLAEHGELEAKSAGASDRVWWRPVQTASSSTSPGPALEEYPSLVNDVLDGVAVGVVVLDAEFTVAWINEAAKRYLGLAGMDVIGRDKRALVRETITGAVAEPDDFADTVLSTYDDNTYAEEFEVRTTPEGEDDRWLEHRSKPIETGRYAGGRVEFYYDVTDRKRTDEERQLQLSVSQSIAEAATLEDGLRAALRDVCQWTDWEVGQAWVPNDDGRVERSPASYVESESFASFEAASRDFTFGPGEGIPGRVLELTEPVWFHDVTSVPADVYPRTDPAAEVGLRAGLGVPVVADGELAVVLEFYRSDRREADDRLVETVASVARDLGSLVSRKQTERALDRQYALLEQVMEAAPVGISVFGADGDVERANSRALALHGLSGSDEDRIEVADRAFYDERGDPIPLDDRPFARVMDTGSPVYGWEARVEPSGEKRKWLSVNAEPITDDDGEIQWVVVVEEDITELKAQYRAIMGAANDVIVTIDEDSVVRSVNPAIEEMFGYDRAELLGESLTTLMPDELVDRHYDAFGRYLETGERTLDWDYVELPGVRADGTEIPLAISFSEIEYEGEQLFTGIIRDITERKEREQALREERNLIERIVETSPVGIATLDADGAFDLVNDRTEEILGYLPDAVGDQERRTELLKPIASDGTAIAPDETPTYRILENGETVHDVEVGIERRDGERVWVSVSGTPMRDGDRITGAVVTFADVTERKEYQRKLEESNERLEQFAYAVSHDLQEPLRMVSSYLRLIENRYADELDEDGREFIEFAVDGAGRMRDMIDGLLEYSRVETRGDPFEPVDMDAVASDVLDDLQVRIEERDAEVETEPLPRVEGDPDQLRQVVQNLVSNALTYSGDEPPRVHISAEREGNEWVISVSDEGIGIDPEDQDRIFEVFERLHGREEHEGTGIGLALCRRIVERHGGDVWVESEPGEGATFSFTLPAADGEDPDAHGVAS
ncbi:PAS domain S-box protein [Halostella sp. JP-L12]|uniref:PAS domain S-box protein n=1 Tax=Halostella TaxID=1843185 RepID=UPI0013CF12F8|nr:MULTISPECIES: PAS domain S-box protein [Halostella]NHN47775.1 PAS domain S-box protein [Halostella sp. JP-L12]